MNPIKFKECNITYAENQKEYLPLPVLKCADGQVLSCWKLSFFERVKIILTGKVWLNILTFNQPLQPIIMMINKPKLETTDKS